MCLKIQEAEEIKKEEEKHRCLFNYLMFSHVSYFIFKGQGGKCKVKSLSLASRIIVMSLNGQATGT